MAGTYSPSTYLQRLPIIALGVLGFFIARYLAAYQMGHVDHIIEPFFVGVGELNGTETIITSDVSKSWPIPDAGLGAVTYMFEILMGVMGDRRRWRTMPWMVTMFIIVVVPLGAMSIYFIIIQPIVIGTYCSLCLLAELGMVIMIPYALDELIAMGQYLVQSHRRGESVIRAFFMGGASPGSGQDKKPDFGACWSGMITSANRGVTMPWTLTASALLGIWLMFSRLVFGTAPSLADSDHLVGALVLYGRRDRHGGRGAGTPVHQRLVRALARHRAVATRGRRIDWQHGRCSGRPRPDRAQSAAWSTQP